MKVKTSELSGAALDWAVGIADQPDGAKLLWRLMRGGNWRPSTDWSQGGPIIEREDIAISALPDGLCRAYAPGGTQWVPHGELGLEVFKWTHKQEGYTPLIAAMRCFVASRLGDEVEVPEELLS